jgi:hypothetical protein
LEIVIVRYKKVLSHTSDLNYSNVKFIQMYLRPVRGCTSGGCVIVPAMVAGLCCLGLLTLVLLLANSSLIVWGRSGSNLTPCWKREKPDKSEGECVSAHCGSDGEVFTKKKYYLHKTTADKLIRVVNKKVIKIRKSDSEETVKKNQQKGFQA